MRRERGRDRERGAMLLIMGAVLLLFGIVALGILTVERVVIARQEVQIVADTACLVATSIVRHEGLPFDSGKQARAAGLANRNHPGLDFAIRFNVSETETRLDVQCSAALDVGAPTAIWSGGTIGVGATSRASIAQVTETQATRLYPKLVLVLDYSGSMVAHLGDKPSQPRSIDKLREAVNLLLNTGASFKYGLVMFATGVLDTSPVALGSETTIRNKVRASPGNCPSDPTCMTNSAAALQKARQLLQQSGDTDEAKYVLFVSDGMPTRPTGDQTKDENAAFSAVQGLWSDDVAMITLHIINVAADQVDAVKRLQDFMKRLSGFPEKPSDPTFYFNADSDATLEAAFKNLGNTIGCPLTPLDPPPKDPKKLHVFVKDGGVEIPLENAALGTPKADNPGDLTDSNGPYYQGNYFFYREKNHSIYLTQPVCSMVIDQGDAVVIRSGSGRLTQ